MRCIIMLYIQLTLFLLCFRAPLPYCSALATLSLHCTHKIHPQLPITDPGWSHSAHFECKLPYWCKCSFSGFNKNDTVNVQSRNFCAY